MQIKQTNLRERLDQVRLSRDLQLAQVLVSKVDVSYARIQEEFGVSEKVIRRVLKQFNIRARKRGPKNVPNLPYQEELSIPEARADTAAGMRRD